MEIAIEPVTSIQGESEMMAVRRQVFEREMNIELPPLPELKDDFAAHFLARVVGRPVAALSVVDTTGDETLHERCGLSFAPDSRVVRYTQLAVLRPFRGLNIPAMLIIEAHRRFVAPGRYEYSWLMFDAARASSSFLRRLFAFEPCERIFVAEYGPSRVLVRDERSARAIEAIRQTELRLAHLMQPTAMTPRSAIVSPGGA